MRRFAFALSVFAIVAGLLLTTGCQRDRSFRIVTINKGAPLMSDLIDFGEITIREPGEDPETYTISEVPSDIVDIELQYVEIGLGLPTWTPYVASVEKATISYTNLTTGEAYDVAIVSMSASVESDPEGKKTATAKLNIAPGEWKDKVFGDEAQSDPTDDDYGPVAQVRATVTVEGYDYVSNKRVKAVKDCDITFGNFWDEPTRLGQ
ncbi:MAG: hypothetical protein R6X12_04430 [bacterium]